MITEEMDAFFSTADLAVSAVLVTGTSTSTAAVYFDTPSQAVISGNVILEDPSIVLPSTVTVSRGSTVTIASVSYTVRQVEKIGDGALQRAAMVLA